VLRLFHQLLGDASLRSSPQHKEVLLLATRVVRGLFAKLAPPPATAADVGVPPAAEQDDTQAASTQQQQVQVQVEREQRRRDAVAGMVAVELMFWNHANTCDLISDEYKLKEPEQ